MNDFEKTFALRMNRIRSQGYDFEAGSRAALEAKFGGGVDVFIDALSDRAKEDPERFAAELSRTLGRGSLPFLGAIIRYADDGKFPLSVLQESPVDVLADHLSPIVPPVPRVPVPLHDSRIKDDLSWLTAVPD